MPQDRPVRGRPTAACGALCPLRALSSPRRVQCKGQQRRVHYTHSAPPRVLRLMAGPSCRRGRAPVGRSPVWVWRRQPHKLHSRERLLAHHRLRPGSMPAGAWSPGKCVAVSCSLHMILLLSVFLSVWVWRCQPQRWGASCTAVSVSCASPRHSTILRRRPMPRRRLVRDCCRLFSVARSTCYSLPMPIEEAETVLTRDDLQPSRRRPFVC